MPFDSNQAPEPPDHRSFLVYTSLALVVAGLAVGWIFYSRHQQNRAIEEKAAAQKRADDAKSYQMLGGNQFAILSFYVGPSSINRGDETRVCYSVSNAKSVIVEPPIGEVWPSYGRCVQVTPSRTTTYKLTIDDGAGHSKTATATVSVH